MSALVETNNATLVVFDSDQIMPVTLRVTEKEFSASGVASVDTLPSISYLQIEFPTECWNFPNVSTTVTHFLEYFFVAKLPDRKSVV